MNTPAYLHRAPLSCRGFTLIELAIVLAIASVLLWGALPSFTRLLASVRITSAASTFVAGLQLARSESIKRNTRVVMCKSSDGQSCAPSGDWNQGWIIFQDLDDDANRSWSEALIWRESGLNAEIKVVGNANVAKYLSFAPVGGTKLTSGAFQAGTVTVCKRGMSEGTGRQIVVNAAGRPRVQKAAIASC